MESITIYTTSWCPDCRYAKSFLRERGVAYREVDIEEDEAAEEIVIKANDGRATSPNFGSGRPILCVQPL